MADPDLCRIAGAFSHGSHSCTSIGSSSGITWSAFAHVEARGGTWCLRSWPPGTDPATPTFVHAVLRHARARGFQSAPRLAATGETVVVGDGSCFDAQDWVAGLPLAPTAGGSRSPPRVPAPARSPQHAGNGRGRVPPQHARLPAAHRRQPPLAWRLAAADRELRHHRPLIEAWLRAESDTGLRELTREGLALLPGAIAHAAALPAAATAPTDRACAIVHGDLWAPNVFFAGIAFVGFVDFESLAWDTPAIDLAQLVLHFNGWAERAVVFEAYAAHRPLTAEDAALLPAAAMLDLAGERLWCPGMLAPANLQPARRDRHIANLRALPTSFRDEAGLPAPALRCWSWCHHSR